MRHFISVGLLTVVLFSIPLYALESELWWEPDFNNGMKHINKKEIKEAEFLFRSILEKDDDIAKAHFGMGMVHYSNDPASQDALSEFRRATQLDRNYGRAYYQMGMVYKNREKRILKARDYFKKAVAKDPTICEAWLEIGNANKVLDMPEQTLKSYNKAIRHNPDNKLIFEQFLEIALWMQENENIIETIEFLIDQYPDNPQYYLNLAHVYFASGYYKLSHDQLVDIEKRFPDFSDSLLDLLYARNFFNMQEDKKGLNRYWQAIESMNDSATIKQVYNDVCYLMTEEENNRLEHTRIKDLTKYYERFWNLRDPNFATIDNERIAEHYRRLSYAQKHFRRYTISNRHNEVLYENAHPYAAYNIQGSKMLEAAGFPSAVVNRERNLDDLGVIFIRHGLPDDQARSIDGMPSSISPEYLAMKMKQRMNYEEDMYRTMGSQMGLQEWLQKVLEAGYTSDAQLMEGASRVPRPDQGESLFHPEYFYNLPMNVTWKYYQTETRPEMVFHFKKYGEFLGWVIEAIPYAPAERETLDPRYGELGVISFLDRPDIEQVKRICMEIKDENLRDLKKALKTESSNYKHITRPLTVPYTFLCFKGEKNQTDIELYYLLEGSQTILDKSQNPPELSLETFLGMYDHNWDPSVRIKKTEKFPVNIRPDVWKYNSAVRADHASIKPGQHVYELQFTDLISHKTGVYKDTLQIPNFYNNKLAISDVILSGPITAKTEYSKFTKNDITFSPHMFSAYNSNATVGMYFEIYNLVLDNEFKTHFNIDCTLKPAGPIENLKEQKLYGFFKSLFGKEGQTGTSFNYTGIARDDNIYLNLAIGNQETGIYDLIINIKDLNSGDTISQKVGLTIEGSKYQASND